MAIELHWLSGSPYAWRVQLALEIKGLTYTLHQHQISTGELKSPEYLALNPRGRVPTLIDDGFVLYESLAILAYLDSKYPTPALFGTTPQATGIIWRVIAEHAMYMDDNVEHFTVPIYFGQLNQKEAAVRRAAEKLYAELDYLEGLLEGHAYLAGPTLTAADIVVFPPVKAIERAAAKDAAKPMAFQFLPFENRWPNMAKWMMRIEAIEGYERTYPPHWRS
jgi:glutathione S-transferase